MADEKPKPKPTQINIELNAETAKGVYSNLAMITHFQSEFIIDFVQILPGTPKAEVRSRVIMTPQNAKRLSMALSQYIQNYEHKLGEIKLGENEEMPLPPNFSGPQGFA